MPEMNSRVDERMAIVDPMSSLHSSGRGQRPLAGHRERGRPPRRRRQRRRRRSSPRCRRLAVRTGAINLGQGFPDVDGPEYVKQAAIRAIEEGRNQYAPGDGVPELRRAIADHQKRHYGLDVDPDTEVLVTTGATEALAATILALTRAGDEVLTLEPFYDSHAAVDRHVRRHARDRTPGPRAGRLPARRRGAPRSRLPAPADDRAQLPAQPDRRRCSPGTSWPPSPRWLRSATR